MRMSDKAIKWGAGLAIFVNVLLLVHSAFVHSPSVDEVGHLPAGISHWELGRFELYAVNPPLVRMIAAIPVMAMNPITDWSGLSHDVSQRAEWPIGRRFIKLNQGRSLQMWFVARLVLIPVVVLGALCCFAFSGEVFGKPASLIATLLWCFSPTILAHGSMITPDATAASLGVCAFYRFRIWLDEPEWWNAVVFSAASAAAVLAKSTWIVVLPLSVLILVIFDLFVCHQSEKQLQRRATQLLVAGALGIFLINALYGFEGTFTQLSDIPFRSQLFASNDLPGITQPYDGFESSFLGDLPAPLPMSLIQGIDVQKSDFERRVPSYLMGEWKNGGWWYYYLVGFVVKEPIPFQILLYLSVLSGIWNWRSMSRRTVRDCAVLLVPAVLIIVLASSQTGLNHHVRYILPAYAFLVIFAARTATRGPRFKGVTFALLAWQIVSTIWFSPHWLSYFNEVAGGPTKGHEWLVDSNIDWGQDIMFLKSWQDSHPEVDQLSAAIYTMFDPADIGVKYKLPPPFVVNRPDIKSAEGLRGPQPGWYAISASQLRGHRFMIPAGNHSWYYSHGQFKYFLEYFEPTEMIGFSIYLYHIDAEEAAIARSLIMQSEHESLEAASNTILGRRLCE